MQRSYESLMQASRNAYVQCGKLEREADASYETDRSRSIKLKELAADIFNHSADLHADAMRIAAQAWS